MTADKCKKCGGLEFKEAVQYEQVKANDKGKFSLHGSNIIFTYCTNCGEVKSIRLENPNFAN